MAADRTAVVNRVRECALLDSLLFRNRIGL
jgi:hypothetical protein